MKKHLLFLLVMIGWLISSCSQGVDFNQPPEVRFGEDACDQCSMIINEARYAAAYYTEAGEVRRFDDIGDMCVFHIDRQETVQTFWAHDFYSEDWIRASATYVLGEDLYTPMAFGVVAFAERSAADQFAGEAQGMVLDFHGVMDHFSHGDHSVDEHHEGKHSIEGVDHMDHEHGVKSGSAGD